jgi:hypothetical protein
MVADTISRLRITIYGPGEQRYIHNRRPNDLMFGPQYRFVRQAIMATLRALASCSQTFASSVASHPELSRRGLGVCIILRARSPPDRHRPPG